MTGHPVHTPALVGIGARLPGPGAGDTVGPHGMWEALTGGKTAIGHYPAERWQAMQELLHPADRGGDPWPAALITWPQAVDAKVLGLRASDTAHLSPTQVLVLQVAAEALADAGIRPDTLAGPRTGIYLGAASPDDALRVFAAGAQPTLSELAAGGAGMVATPVSRWLDARGPLVTYDTSCSGSLYALHAARRDLADGTVTTAIVIGASSLTHPVPTRAFRAGPGVLAADGDVRPFDADAHGYVRGEAVVAAVLRPYGQARESHDRIYALIEHTATGSDGRSAGMGMPSADALAELIVRTHTEAGVPADRVPLVITHGPGTKAGARAEARALAQAYRRDPGDPLWIHSVKGLWGHGEAAAGLTGLLAGALMLHHGGWVPPTVGHHRAPDWLTRSGLRVPTDRVNHLPHEPHRRRTGVVALGFSGAIACALLAGVPRSVAPRRGTHPGLGAAAVLPVSARTPERVRALAEVVPDAVQVRTPPALSRLGHHLTHRSTPDLEHRAAVVAVGSTDTTAPAWRALARGEHHPDLVGPPSHPGPWRTLWAFGGHGAAHDGMAADLYTRDRLFAAHLDRALEALVPYTSGPAWRPGRPPRGLGQVQRATWAVQVAMAHTLMDRWGLAPDAVAGHSLGEVAAATVAGILSLSDGALLVSRRADLLASLAPLGGMVAARVDAATAHELAQAHQVDVACLNAPDQVVFSGASEPLRTLTADLTERGMDPRPLPGSPPAHSRHLTAEALDGLDRALTGLRPRPGTLPLVSTVTARPAAGEDLHRRYWAAQLAAPVRWEETVVVHARTGPLLVTEISPRPVLVQPTTRIRARHGQVITAVAAGDPQGERRALALAAATAYTHHQPIRWPYVPCVPVDLAPARWEAPPADADHWPERVAHLDGEALYTALSQVVLAAVAALAPVPVGVGDYHRDLADLGLHSIDRLSLQHRLLHPLRPRPQDLPEHAPTIASITRGLVQLVAERRDRAD